MTKKYKLYFFGALASKLGDYTLLLLQAPILANKALKRLIVIQSEKMFFVSLLQHHLDPY